MGCVLRTGWSLAGIGALVLACESPTLPLPPPAIPIVETTDVPAGEVRLSSMYGAQPYAIIETFNNDPRVPFDKRVGGAQADGYGSWDTLIAGFSGDLIQITQQYDTGTAVSPTIEVRVP